MYAVFGRVIASLASMFLVWLGDRLGFQFTTEETASFIGEVTLLGLAAWGICYAAIHKLINSRIAPMDTALRNAPDRER